MGGISRNRRRKRAIPAVERVAEIGPEHLEAGLLNVIVFGPGRGEAIVVVLPDGSVGIVDGCREPKRSGQGDPVRELLTRLDAIGQLSRLRFACLTHPHDDHYAGFGRLLAAYRGRVEEVWCTFETGSRYAASYISYLKTLHARVAQPDREDPRGLERVLFEMRRVDDPAPRPRTVHEHALMIKERIKTAWLCIRGVAPVTRDVQLAQDALLRSITALRDGDPTVPFDPNQASGALFIEWGAARVLLAGDLTNGGQDPLRGWNLAREAIACPVQVVNVAHHASEGAHQAELWRSMAPALAIVTPFKDGAGSNPPRPGDIDRLVASGAQVAITAIPRWDWDNEKSSLPRPTRRRARTPARVDTKNPVLEQSPSSDRSEASRRNAVAVALTRTGEIRRLVLAGEADLYRSRNSGS